MENGLLYIIADNLWNFIAACTIGQPDSEVVRWIRIIVVLVSMFSCVLIVSNIKVMVALYDKLGYGKTPNDPEELDGIHKDLLAETARFLKQRKSRKRKDRAIDILFLYQYIPSHCILLYMMRRFGVFFWTTFRVYSSSQFRRKEWADLAPL